MTNKCEQTLKINKSVCCCHISFSLVTLGLIRKKSQWLKKLKEYLLLKCFFYLHIINLLKIFNIHGHHEYTNQKLHWNFISPQSKQLSCEKTTNTMIKCIAWGKEPLVTIVLTKNGSDTMQISMQAPHKLK